jgi:hypothetical protein
VRQQAPGQRARLLTIRGNKTLTCGYIGALGGTRTPNLLIRRSGQVVQDRPSPVVGWVDIPELSMCVGGRPAAWLQRWLQSWRNAADPRRLVVSRGVRRLRPWRPGPGPHLRLVSGDMTAPCPAQTPPPNPIAAEPDGRRVLSRVGVADHAVTLEAPWTGSGWRGHSYGGFGGGHSQFQGHARGRQLHLSSMGRRLRHMPVLGLPGTETTVCGWRIAFSSADTCCGRLEPPTTRYYFVGEFQL